MASMSKTVLTVAVVAALIGLGYLAWANYATGEWTDGAPELSVNARISKTGSSSSIDARAAINSQTAPTLEPFTAFTADVEALEPSSTYTITFSYVITIRASSEQERDLFDIATSVSGVAGTGLAYTGPQTSSGTAPHAVAASFVSSPFVTIGANQITGMDVDGSSFTISVTATSAMGYEYSTSATITLSVLPGGVEVTITGVATEVVNEMSELPDGWNVPGHVNYIVVTGPGTGGVYSMSYYYAGAMGGTNTVSGTLSYLRDNCAAAYEMGLMTRTQYDCGIAQINLLMG